MKYATDRDIGASGTDFPHRPGSEVLEGLTAYGFSAAELQAIDRGNALRLMPRLKA